MVNSFVFEARIRRLCDAELNSVFRRGASMSLTQAPLAPPTRCIWWLSPWRSREREIDAGAGSGAASSAQVSPTSAITKHLARTADQGNRCARHNGWLHGEGRRARDPADRLAGHSEQERSSAPIEDRPRPR